jgi:hypothetical protein
MSSSFWHKNRLLKWNTNPFQSYGSEWLLDDSRNKVGHKRMKISGYWTHKKMWRWHWKLFNNRSSRNVSDSNSSTGLSAQLLKRNTLKVTPLSKLRVYKYACNKIIPQIHSHTLINIQQRFKYHGGHKSDAGVGSRRRRRFLDSHGFRFSTTLWNEFLIELRDSLVFSVVETVMKFERIGWFRLG